MIIDYIAVVQVWTASLMPGYADDVDQWPVTSPVIKK